MTENKLYNKLDVLILPVILIIIWYIICDLLMLIPSYMFPGPVEVVNSFINLLLSGKLLKDIIDTYIKYFLAYF